MRVDEFHISNFRAINRLTLSNLKDMVVIAGPNGCGKSATLDALRLLKSAYGGYQDEEWRIWFGEFQIDISNLSHLSRLLRHPSEPGRIQARITLHDAERDYLVCNAQTIATQLAWNEVIGYRAKGRTIDASQVQLYGPQVEELAAATIADLEELSQRTTFELSLTIVPGKPLTISPSPVMQIVFKTYDPQHLGVIDYHSASRAYAREALGGIHLDVTQFEQQRQQSLLYNSQNKYTNVKTELAAQYIRSLIASEATDGTTEFGDLNATLKELFETFFPDKRYLGPEPTAGGSVSFPVHLKSGGRHEIDELSSGEKEILYGYLRLRDSAPRFSVILLDEPELHLNPGLLQGLPDFYYNHVGRAHDNQLWLVTHSDALLRQAVRNQDYSVYHMRSATAIRDEDDQAQEIRVDSGLDDAVIDLVGDLATYKPHARNVLCEGGGGDAFDVFMIGRLFPDVKDSVNLLAGGSRRRVQDLYQVLADLGPRIGQRFFAILDRDSEPAAVPPNASIRHWDRYHIENYLLEPAYVLAALVAVQVKPNLTTPDAVGAALRESAEAVVPTVLAIRLESFANERLVNAISVGGPRGDDWSAAALRPSIEGSMKRFTTAVAALLTEGELQRAEAEHRTRLRVALKTDGWFYEIPGRSVLKRFVAKHAPDMPYERFRNVIVAEMAHRQFKPPGMQALLDELVGGEGERAEG
jgi:energy-coupling factor transporter ATP-binding protein EcfA2